jgi:hypothetical protein
MPPKKKADLKSGPGLVSVRLQLTPEEHARLRVIAARAGQPMAIWCREAVRSAMAAARPTNCT